MSPFRSVGAALRRRSMAEWRDRGRQASLAVLERIGLAADARSAANRRLELEEAPGRTFANPGAALCHFREWAPARFFAGTRDVARTLEGLRDLDAKWPDRLMELARQGLEGRPPALGYQSLCWGIPCDWHLDPVSGRRAPLTHWSQVPFLNAAIVGDHKVTWELNRHQWLVPFAIARHIDRDDFWAEQALRLLDDWMDSNPPKHGINWASSLEIAFRSISWLWILHLLCKSEALTEERFLRLTSVLAIGGRHIERNLSTWFSPNTHLTGEALGLLYLGHALPEFRDARRWRELGLSILVDWMPRHVRPDGTYVEQSTHYARYTVDFLIHAIALLRCTGNEIPETLTGALARGARYLRHIVNPDGRLPLVGDDDGGRVLFLGNHSPEETHSTLAVAAALLDDPTIALPDTKGREEVAWLLGPDALGVPALASTSPPAELSRLFPDGGVATLRDGWNRESSLAVLDCGPHGFGRGGHAHADLGSLDLTVRGHPLVVDPGTWTYQVEGGGRDAFRSAAAHAVPLVDGVGTAEPGAAFSWSREPTVLALSSHFSDSFDIVAFTHDGFHALADPVAHRRALARLPGGNWLVIDTFAAKQRHEVALLYPLSPGLVATADGNGVLVNRAGEPFARFVLSDTFGNWNVVASRVSHAYGQQESAERLVARTSFEGELLVTTLIQTASRARGSMSVQREGEEDVISVGDIRTGGVVLRCGATSGAYIDASAGTTEWTWPALLPGTAQRDKF